MKIKKITAKFLFILISAYIAQSVSSVQAAEPQGIDLKPLLPKTFDHYSGDDPATQLLFSGFYPIGWSRDGKFAYISEPPDEACGCYLLRVVIQDLKTDKILWSHNYVSAEPETALVKSTKSTAAEDLQQFWHINAKVLQKKFRQYGIQQSGPLTLKTGTIADGDDKLRFHIETKKSDDDDMLTYVRLDVISQSRGKKTVYEKDRGSASGYYAASAIGWLPSPYERRIAVVLAEVRRGWEGPPHVISYRLIGASLSAGFKAASGSRPK